MPRQHDSEPFIPLHLRGDLRKRALRDAELAEHLGTVTMTAYNALLHPHDEAAQRFNKQAEGLLEGYLESGSSKPQHPQG